MRDDGLVDGHEGATAVELHQIVDLATGAFEVFFRLADGAIFVNRPGHLRSDVGVGDRLAAFLQDAGAVEGVHPDFPVFAAHDLDRLRDVIGRSGLEGDFVHDLLVGVEVLGVERSAGRLEDGLVGHAVRGGAARGGEGVDDEVDLAAGHLGFDCFDDLRLHFGRESVAIDRDRLEAGLLRFGVESSGVIPAGRARLITFAVAFEKHAERCGAGTKGGRDTGREAVARGGADH